MSEQFGNETIKGEIVVLIAPADNDGEMWVGERLDTLLRDLLATMPVSKAAREAADATGLPKAELYRRLLEIKESGGE